MKIFITIITIIYLSIVPVSVSAAATKLSQAKAFILMEAKTGQILAADQEGIQLPPASTTKILTAIMAIERGEIGRVLTISDTAASVGEASINLDPGEKISVLNLLKGALIKSGNDASYALAEYVGGSEEIFLFLMNRKAKIIGANKTTFCNANGLPDQKHLSTARDLAMLARYSLNNKIFKDIVATKKTNIPWGNYSWQRQLINTNKLLWSYDGADGVKTGTTRSAGSCLIASATKNNRQLIAVILRSPDRFGEAAEMLNYGFSNTILKKIRKGSVCGLIRFPNDRAKYISLVAAEDYEYTVSDSVQLRQRIEILKKSGEKIKQGEYLGFLVLFDSNEPIVRIPLVSSVSS